MPKPIDVLVTPKNFIVVPRDALELLERRAGSLDDAEAMAREMCEEERQTVYVLKLVAVASIEGPPVRFRKL